jgi:hypothetical protein
MVDLFGANVSPETIAVLQADPEAPTFWSSTSRLERELHTRARPIEEAVRAWLSHALSTSVASMAESWAPFESETNAAAFSMFLDRLRETADAQNTNTQPFFHQRVNKILETIHNDNDLRGVCFHIAEEAMQHCGDRIALGLQNMELTIASHRARLLGISDLVHVGKQFFRLNALHDIVTDRIASLNSREASEEELETYLLYQIELKKDLDLPCLTENMLFRNQARVAKKDIQSAREAILKQENGPEMLSFFVEQFPAWSEHLSRAYPADFERVNDLFEERMEKLTSRSEKMPENEYVEQANSLMKVRDSALHELRVHLTKMALSLHTMEQ